MSIAICPGSFDPITLGHLNIIRRTANIFDEVVVCIMVNASKSNHMFTMEERLEMASIACSRYKNVRVESYEGLLAEYAKQFKNAVIVKGLRATSDFEYENQMYLINKSINPELETMFLPSESKYTYISSSLVREMAQYGTSLKGFVPDELIERIACRAQRKESRDGE